MKKVSTLILLLVALNIFSVKHIIAKSLSGYDTTVYVSIPDTTFALGDTVLMPVYGKNFYNIGSVGLYIQYDSTKVEYLGVLNVSITGAMYNAQNGMFMYGWTSVSSALNFGNGILFYLKLYYFKSGKANLSFLVNYCSFYTLSPTYQCDISLKSGSISECTPSLSVISYTSPLSFCSGDSCVLNANIIQNAKYQWRLNNNNITGATNTAFTAKSAGTFQLVVTNSQNCSSLSSGVATTVLTVPTIKSVTPGFACDSGTVTLKATASSGTVNWYNIPSGGNILYSGNTYTTPSLTSTTNFYTDATYNGCTTKSRTIVTASVNTTPTITSTTPGSHCGPGVITLGAAASAGTINWYSAAAGGSAIADGVSFTTTSLSSTTTYYVDATINGCTTQTRTAVQATLKPLPIITGTTGASYCGQDSLILKASASAGTINWYNTSSGGNTLHTGTSFTTPLITATTNFYVDATYNGCTSPARTSVTATIKPIPQITGTTPGFHCGKGVVTLGAAASLGGTVNWYSKPSGGAKIAGGNSFTTPSLSATTTYYVDATTANGCKTLTTTPVSASIFSIPIITNVAPASSCGKSNIALSASASKGIVRWYDSPSDSIVLDSGATFTTPVLSASQNYYVDAKANGCVSPVRTIVSATILPVPEITSTTPASRCGQGTVSLGATDSIGTISWYSQSSGGTLIGTGNSFTTPVIKSSTAYYVDATYNGCTTPVRTPVAANINQLPAVTITSEGNTTFCEGNYVIISIVQTSDSLAYQWLQNGNNLSDAKGSVLLVNLQGQYTVKTTDNNNCSAYSDTISVSVNPLPVVNLGGDKTISVNESIVLDAGSGFKSYLWSNNSTGQKITLKGSELGIGSFTYSVTVTNNSNCEASNSMNLQVVVQNFYTIDGYFTYDNSKSTPIQKTKVILLNNSGEKTDSVITDALGHYVFTNVGEGKYKFNAHINLKWGGADPVDALLINRSYLHLVTFADNLKKLAADVNADKKINPVDALIVNRRYIRCLNSFKAGDWLFITDSAYVNNANVTKNLKAICAGDVNGSYVPSNNKIIYREINQNSEIVNLNLSPNSQLYTPCSFDLPVYLNDYAELGALGIKLKLNNENLKINGISSDIEGLIYNVDCGLSTVDCNINIAWAASDIGYNISPDKPLFTLHCLFNIQHSTFNIDKSFQLPASSFQITSESVISDFDANTISTDKLVIPAISYQLSTVNCQLFRNYPNPFNSITTISYSISEDANVNINVYNVLGEKVANLVDEFQSAGKYTFMFDRNGLKEGVYYCRMSIENANSNINKTNIMMITR